MEKNISIFILSPIIGVYFLLLFILFMSSSLGFCLISGCWRCRIEWEFRGGFDIYTFFLRIPFSTDDKREIILIIISWFEVPAGERTGQL